MPLPDLRNLLGQRGGEQPGVVRAAQWARGGGLQPDGTRAVRAHACCAGWVQRRAPAAGSAAITASCSGLSTIYLSPAAFAVIVPSSNVGTVPALFRQVSAACTCCQPAPYQQGRLTSLQQCRSAAVVPPCCRLLHGPCAATARPISVLMHSR